MGEYKINLADRNTRKKWLIVNFLTTLALPLLSLLFYGFFFKYQPNNETIIDSFLDVIGGSIAFFLFYHCAYKKYGTGLLTLCLILGPISMIIEIYGILAGIEIFVSNISIPQFLVDIALYPFWYNLSFKLRKINKKIRAQAFFNSPYYIRANDIFNNSTTIEDLNAKFGALMTEQNDRDLHREAVIAAAYESRKAVLYQEIF